MVPLLAKSIVVPICNFRKNAIWDVSRDYEQPRHIALGMAAPTGLLVAWLIVAFIATHSVSYVAHRGSLSAFWAVGYIVSLVVPIWSSCTLVAVALAISVQALGAVAMLKIKLDQEYYTVIAFTTTNYLVWAVSYVTTDPASPTLATLLAAAGASVAFFVLALVVPMIAKFKLE